MKLVDFDQAKLLPEERFFANGLELVELGGFGKIATDGMIATLRELWDEREAGRVRQGFTWEQKMPNVFHLRPTVYQYSDIFLNFLYYNRIDQKLRDLTGKRLHLCHAQVVVQTPGPPHQDWHRDAYQFGEDPIVGAFPAAVKVNFYPRFDEAEPRLKFVRGSHRCMANNPRFDDMLISKYENEVLESSNERALIFDSALLHAVVPDAKPKGSIRVMYSFAMEHEYKKRFADKPHHRELHDRFERYRESYAEDKFADVEEYVRKQLKQGYGGNPYVNDLESELKYDGEVSAYENVLDHIEWIKRPKEQDE